MNDELLDAYLDGRLDEAARREVEAELERDPALRGLKELQAEIDGSIGRLATPPDPKAILARARADLAAEREAEAREDQAEGRGKVIKGPWGRRAILALAACLLLALGLALFHGGPTGPSREVAAIYDRRVHDGFQPDWVCRDAAEFESNVSSRLGRTMRLAVTPPAGVKVLGLGYEPDTLSPGTMVVLARVDDQPVLVVIDKLTADRTLTLPPGSPLKLHRRQVADLVLYEVSPFDAVRAIPALEIP